MVLISSWHRITLVHIVRITFYAIHRVFRVPPIVPDSLAAALRRTPQATVSVVPVSDACLMVSIMR